MPTKALEIDFGVIVGRSHADRGMAQLVEIPAGRILLPECVSLTVREARIAIRRQVSTPRKTGLALGHEEWPCGRGTARSQIFVQQRADGTREKHLAGTVAFSVDENRAIRPGNIFKIDSQRFLAA